jgi:L-asparaginase
MYPLLYFYPERGFMPSTRSTVVVVGTGGTIAGTAADAAAHLGYIPGALGADELVASIPALKGQALEVLSLAQLDSCDMDHATWLRLARVVNEQLERPEVAGVVITHGTDTLEETALFLHLTVKANKAVVLTAAMRPATAPSPDGPQNLVDAVHLARNHSVRGVLVAFAGQVFAGAEVRKVHGYRVDAFTSGDAPPLAVVQNGVLQQFRAWPEADATFAAVLQCDAARWPRVDIVTSHAGADGGVLDAVVQAGALGVVIAGTGNGSVHRRLMAAARSAQGQGVVVVRASRCLLGGVVGRGTLEGGGLQSSAGGAHADLPCAGGLTPAQARVRVLLELVAAMNAASKNESTGIDTDGCSAAVSESGSS